MNKHIEAWRLDSYYYGFGHTGSEAIDRILSAVAAAGRAYHHTEEWADAELGSHRGHEGISPVEWIQNAANDAARELGMDALKEKSRAVIAAAERCTYAPYRQETLDLQKACSELEQALGGSE